MSLDLLHSDPASPGAPVAHSHLDLGCGTLPRNPYGRSALFGVDSWDRWRRERRGKLVYFLWELEAVKAPASTSV